MLEGPRTATVAAMTTAVARLSAPADLVAVVPHLVGFVPTESLVLLALQGPRRRVRTTMRLDLPQADAADRVAASMLARLRALRADAVVVLVYTEEPGPLPRREVADALVRRCERTGLAVAEALLVRSGRFWSYTCTGPCCPAEGMPLPSGVSGPVRLVQAERAMTGRAVLADRAALEAALAAPADSALPVAYLTALDDPLWAGTSRTERLALLRTALDGSPRLTPLAPADAARLALALHDLRVRDEVATWVLDEPDRLLALLHELARQTPPPWDAPVCTVLGWTAYATGDGGTANVALDRALATDPAYSLALLLRTALEGMVSPDQVRELLRDTARALR